MCVSDVHIYVHRRFVDSNVERLYDWYTTRGVTEMIVRFSCLRVPAATQTLVKRMLLLSAVLANEQSVVRVIGATRCRVLQLDFRPFFEFDMKTVPRLLHYFRISVSVLLYSPSWPTCAFYDLLCLPVGQFFDRPVNECNTECM